jgi:hypothetical protein
VDGVLIDFSNSDYPYIGPTGGTLVITGLPFQTGFTLSATTVTRFHDPTDAPLTGDQQSIHLLAGQQAPEPGSVVLLLSGIATLGVFVYARRWAA